LLNRVTVLINLAPRALRGLENQGMISVTETADGKLVFLNPDSAHDTTNGLKIS
jgi:methionyl-tRNA synthetase|tara:strand:- start:336 stop:497 length:162 start_codon:yes stop_codon:yes gene_type:complete